MNRLALPLALGLLLLGSGCRHRHYSHVMYVEAQPANVVVMKPAAAEPVVVVEAPPESAPFDRDAAARALAAVDISSCRADDGPHGQVHANVTYLASGNVSRVTIDRPAGLSVPTIACIGRQVGAARVPAFDGASVTVSRSFGR